MPGVILERITKSIGDRKILDNVSLEIEEGAFVCLLGPAGGGKTTLLKIIAGLETPDSGNVYFGKENVTDLPPYKRDVSMVFQDFALYPHMSVFNNLASPLVARKLSKPEIEKRVNDVAKFLKIDRFLNRKITQLSGGEMQRVSIGRALAKEAKIVLFDEIFGNLDYKLREEMRVEFKGLVDKLNITTIFSTPDPEDALSLATKVAIVHEGKIVQYDTTQRVYQFPIDLFTGSYFGYPEMNLIDCVVFEKNGQLYIDADSFEILIGEEKKVSPGNYVLGIRPENIYISEKEKPAQGVVLRGKMLMTEVIGSDTIVHLAIGKHRIESFVPGIYRSVSEKELWVGFVPENIYLFDKESNALESRGM